MQSVIQKIVDRLAKYPEAKYTADEDSITVLAKDEHGFDVSLGVTNEFIVSADVWHEHFKDEDEALDCFAFLLSDSCRLRIQFRGENPTQWTIESYKDEQWVEDSTTGLLTINFWSPQKTVYYQNNFIKTRD